MEKQMNQTEAIDSTAKFLLSCIEKSLAFSFAIISCGDLDNYYVQFLVITMDDKVNGEIQYQVVGIENSQSNDSSDHERFKQILKRGWERDDYGNAERFSNPLRQLSEVAQVVENTISTLITVYQLGADTCWKIQLTEEEN